MKQTATTIIDRFYIAWNVINKGQKIEFDLNMLTRLVEDYNINPYWLLTGSGDMINETPLSRIWLN